MEKRLLEAELYSDEEDEDYVPEVGKIIYILFYRL